MSYRIIDSPWPEREGLSCRIVTRPQGAAGRHYPWSGLAHDEVVIAVKDDPFLTGRVALARSGWSCVIPHRCLEPEYRSVTTIEVCQDHATRKSTHSVSTEDT